MITWTIVLRILAFMVGVMAGLKVLKWKRHPESRPCWFFGHDKRWLAIRQAGPAVPGNTPGSVSFICQGIHVHKLGDQPYYARWACRRCPLMTEECVGCDQDWTIEHETLVPDTKKWANWSREKP